MLPTFGKHHKTTSTDHSVSCHDVVMMTISETISSVEIGAMYVKALSLVDKFSLLAAVSFNSYFSCRFSSRPNPFEGLLKYNLVPRVFSLSNMAAAGEKSLAHSELKRSLIGAFPSAYHPPYCYFFFFFVFHFYCQFALLLSLLV